MKKRIISVFLVICICLSLAACSIPLKKDSYFRIRFIDVGQGDAALVECDGQYMLIDGGDKTHGDKVCSILADERIQHLNILAISHFHKDHIGGLTEVLKNPIEIDITIANSYTDVKEQDEGDTGEKSAFNDLEHLLYTNHSSITVPHIDDKFSLGSATVEVVYVGNAAPNDSLVLLITYGKTRFLFTGDIEGKAQKDLADHLRNDSRVKKGVLKVNVIKMPHHGAFNEGHGSQANNLNSLFWLLKPDYAVISVGKNNRNNHPHQNTLDLLSDAKKEKILKGYYRTDMDGDIIVRSNGRKVYVAPIK